MRPENVALDLGGVLIEWNPRRIVEAVFEEPDVCDRVLSEVFLGSNWRAFDAGELTEREAVSLFSEKTGRSLAEMTRLFQAYIEELVPYPHTECLLERLSQRGYRLFVLSNINGAVMDYLRERFHFWLRFNGIVASGYIHLSKPDTRIFEHLLQTYALEPSRTVLVDDRPENIAGAQAAGMRGILFESAAQLERELN